MDEENISDRERALGFKPQKENRYNKLLPYSEIIDEESIAVLAEIKGNLGRAVQLRDLKYGAGHWIGQLSRYIRLYGMKFSKEDHLAFIRLLFELTIIPDLEMSLVQKFAMQLTHLLKKKDLLSPADLTLPWKPLYKLLNSVLYSPYEHHGLQLFPANIEQTLKQLVIACRNYFPLEATQEMLAEWRPLLCPFDISVIEGLNYLELFLPTNLPQEHMEKGFKLWFKELIDMWDSFQNTPSWENSLISLMSRLAHDNIGYIDWSPYVSRVFNRLLRSFNLPVGTQSIQIGRNSSKLDTEPTIIWIVSMMGGTPMVQEHITKLFKTLQTFYHPSNLGKWNLKLSSLLMYFPKFFVRRLHRERYKKTYWMKPIPDIHKLTDAEVTQFVESMKSTVFTSMFSKYGSQDSAVALRHLSTLRPELIVPPLLEKMYPAMETLIEPHRLIACMNCVVSVARSMLNADKWYPEGKLHVLPLLNLSLPGIDPNDFKKCLVTFQMISTFVSLVPIVDCSEALLIRTDLTETEREVCSATAQFEDFVLQFLDRIFVLIENSAQDQVHGNQEKLNPEQTMLEIGMASTFTSVLQQCSTPIYMSALRRIDNFVSTTVYECRVGGRFAANLVRATAKVNPEAALKALMNKFCDNILEHIRTHEDLFKEENLDDGFQWNLLMFSQLLRCDGAALVKYKDRIVEVLLSTLGLQCVEGYEKVATALRSTLRALTTTYPLNYRSTGESLDRPVAEYLAIRDWAKPGDTDQLGMEWHIPTTAEMQFAQELIDKVLTPEIEIMKKVTADQPMQREELLRRLHIILECLIGGGCVMPMWDGQSLTMIESVVPMKRFGCNTATEERKLTMGGKNIRMTVSLAMRPLLSHMMSCAEDYTKGLCKILTVYETVLFFSGMPKTDFDGRWKSFHIVKKALEDRLRGGKRHIRALLVDRVFLQHEMRCLQVNNRTFTEHHKEMLQDLFSVSISRYSEVRKRAQSVLFQHSHSYPYSYRVLLDQIVEKLQNSECPEHEFQGVLYVLLGNSKRCMTTKRSWEVSIKIWPALIQAQHSEKISILNLVDSIISKTVKHVETTAIKIEVNESSLSAAGEVLSERAPCPCHQLCTPQELHDAAQSEVIKNTENLRMYESLVTKIVDLLKTGNLTWRFYTAGMDLLSLLIRHDVPTPVCAVDLIVNTCLHDSLAIRKCQAKWRFASRPYGEDSHVARSLGLEEAIASGFFRKRLSTQTLPIGISTLSAIMKQQKRKHKKIKIDPLQQTGNSSSKSEELQPGDRGDNQWHCYNQSNLPVTQEKWENLAVVEKTHWGYYSWPKMMETYAPKSEQPKLNRSREELLEGERCVYDAFTNADYVSKLIKFLSLEENKGKDKFSNKKMSLFKGLFRNYGDCLLALLKPHIEQLISDTSHDKHDSSQRCAMEMLAGILSGSKHWPYTQTASLWDWANPLLKSALNSLTVSTLEDWGIFYTIVSENRDPRKIYWFFEMLMDNPFSGDGGSFGDAGRLYMIQSALLQQEWRVSEMHHRLLTFLKNHLSHHYKNVRDRISSLLSTTFMLDYQMFDNSQSYGPARKEFLSEVIGDLEQLKELVINEAQHQNGNGEASPSEPVQSTANGTEPMEVDGSEEKAEEKRLIRLCKTVMKCISVCVGRTFNTAPEEILQLLPIMCTLQSESKDEELASDCSMCLACLSQALLHPQVIPKALATIKSIIGLQSWHARAAVLSYVQVMVFCNFFTLSQPKYCEEIKETVMHLLCDEKLEVREMATITLSGLLQCGYLQMDKDMLGHFERLSTTKIGRRSKTENIVMEKLIKRHAGVLGLSAYVQAYPYDVPEFMPDILMDLSGHLNDPQPIQMTVKKTLSNFRRTHHDNWHDHKLMFTDDQLVILTDLLVSPNYYA